MITSLTTNSKEVLKILPIRIHIKASLTSAISLSSLPKIKKQFIPIEYSFKDTYRDLDG